MSTSGFINDETARELDGLWTRTMGRAGLHIVSVVLPGRTEVRRLCVPGVIDAPVYEQQPEGRWRHVSGPDIDGWFLQKVEP